MLGLRLVPWGCPPSLSVAGEHMIFKNFCKEPPKRHVLPKVRQHLHNHTELAVSEKRKCRGLDCRDLSILFPEMRNPANTRL